MDAYKGYYSVIQFCPDWSRAEAANIGVLLFCPELDFIEAKTSKRNARVRKFFGVEGFDGKRLKSTKQSIRDRLKVEKERFQSLEDLEKFVRSRAGDVQLTSPRGIKVREPKAELESLFEELVERSVESRPDEFAKVDRIFQNPTLKGRVRFDERIPIPDIGIEVQARYAYQNGVLNLVKPEHFASGVRGVNKAMQLAFEGELVKHPADRSKADRKLIVIVFSENTAKGIATRDQAIRVLSFADVRAIKESDLESFSKEVEEQAH